MPDSCLCIAAGDDYACSKPGPAGVAMDEAGATAPSRQPHRASARSSRERSGLPRAPPTAASLPACSSLLPLTHCSVPRWRSAIRGSSSCRPNCPARRRVWPRGQRAGPPAYDCAESVHRSVSPAASGRCSGSAMLHPPPATDSAAGSAGRPGPQAVGVGERHADMAPDPTGPALADGDCPGPGRTAVDRSTASH